MRNRKRRYRRRIEKVIDPHGKMRRSIHLIKNVDERYGLNAGGPNSTWSSGYGISGVVDDQYFSDSEYRTANYARLAEVSTPYPIRFWLWVTFRMPNKIRCLKCRKRIGRLDHGEHYFCACGLNHQSFGNGLIYWEGPSINYPNESDVASTFSLRHPELAVNARTLERKYEAS